MGAPHRTPTRGGLNEAWAMRVPGQSQCCSRNPRDATDTDDPDEDLLGAIKAGISAARGAALLVETTASGLGDRAAAPQTDWKANRLGPAPPEAMVSARRSCLRPDARRVRMFSPALFDDSDGTA